MATAKSQQAIARPVHSVTIGGKYIDTALWLASLLVSRVSKP